MLHKTLSTYISPCPNDTFIFGPLLHGEVKTPYTFDVQLEDIERLNQIALHSNPDLIKVSAVLYPTLKERYRLLPSGGALGKGVGPLLVSTTSTEDIQSVALPGAHTTAHFLFDYIYPEFKGKKKELLFSDIQDAVITGDVDAGVLIHEGRFTYHDKGLKLIKDLGESWQELTDKPIPLGIIMLNRALGEDTAMELTKAIQHSIQKSWDSYPELSDFVRHNAQELSEDTMRQHIELYVNEYSMDMGTEGEEALFYIEKKTT